MDAGVHVIDAEPGVMRQGVPVARLDQQHEQRQITPEVKHLRVA